MFPSEKGLLPMPWWYVRFWPFVGFTLLFLSGGIGTGEYFLWGLIDHQHPWWLIDLLFFVGIGLGLLGLGLKFVVSGRIAALKSWAMPDSSSLAQARSPHVGEEFLRKWAAHTVQVPPRRRTIVMSERIRLENLRTVQVDFPWLTFVQTPWAMFLFWSEKPWKTPEEGVKNLKIVIGSSHNERYPGALCLGPNVHRPYRVEHYWQTKFLSIPSFGYPEIPREVVTKALRPQWGRLVKFI